MIYIGIDPGKHTGVAAWDSERKAFISIDTMLIHQAMDYMLKLRESSDIFVIFEDARLRKWYGDKTNAKLQGAGSVKRDCVIWEDFLTDNNIKHKASDPRTQRTKLTSQTFQFLTSWGGRTSEHARDAAMLVFGR